MPRATPREIRLNLLVLAIILILVAPGGILLFLKKSQPGARPIGAADVVINTTAYMDPYAGPGVERLAPLAIIQWTHSLLPPTATPITPITNPTRLIRRKSSTVGSEIPFPDVDLLPIATIPASENHYLQGLAQTPTEATLLLWSDSPITSITVNTTPTTPTQTSTHNLPKDLRHALQDIGFIDPPPHVTLITLPAKPADPITLTFAKTTDTLPPRGDPKSP